MAEVVVTGADRVAQDLLKLGIVATGGVYTVTQKYGQLLHANVVRRASLPRTGPPGPRIQTGNYVRSINLRTRAVGGGAEASVGTNAPQARRLEYGFSGADSLGRNYNQPPYAHWHPALDEVGPAYQAAIAAMIAAAT